MNHIVSFKQMMRRDNSDKTMFNKKNYLNEIEQIIDVVIHLKIKDTIFGNSSLSSKIKLLIENQDYYREMYFGRIYLPTLIKYLLREILEIEEGLEVSAEVDKERRK